MCDVVGVLPELMGRGNCFGRVFNVGSDHPITINELAQAVIKTLGLIDRQARALR